MKGGLLGGLTPWHVRRLCDNSWEGGFGYTPQQVGALTLDQILMLLGDRKMLKGKTGRRSRETKTEAAMAMADKDGMVKGRAADGSPMRARVTGKSKAKQLLEAQQKKRKRKK